ncbi:MAG: hypothetical protein WCS37_00490 [Chloroflexota bacterium]|nr:hypothetical protein [Chloroflexota bacterium]
MGGLDFGALLDLVNGIIEATKPKDEGEGQGSLQIDYKKIGLVLLTFAGKQGMSWFLTNRRQKKEARLLARGIRPDSRRKKRGGKLLRGLVVSSGLGLVGYLLVMKPEEREILFKNINKVVDETLSLVNEVQGKPYSNNYEKNG